jgi:hypothetical protein
VPLCTVRWYEGRRHAEEVAKEEGWDFKEKHEELYENIHPFQPYVSKVSVNHVYSLIGV